MRKFYVKRAVFLMAFLGLTACTEPSQVASTDNTPQPPADQTPAPTLVEHRQGWPEYQQRLKELKSMQETIRSKYSELSRQKPPAPGEPVFPGQAPTKRDEIIQACDSLESGAQELLNYPYLRESKGESIDATELIRYAQETRRTVLLSGS